MDGIGLVLVMGFYLAILVCGIWIARRKNILTRQETTKVIRQYALNLNPLYRAFVCMGLLLCLSIRLMSM